MVLIVKKLPAVQEPGFGPWTGKVTWRREWPPTPAFLPREFHGLNSRGSWQATVYGVAESDMTEQLTLSLSIVIICIKSDHPSPRNTESSK